MQNSVRRNIILALLSGIVLVIFGFLIYNYEVKASQEKNHLEALIAEAKPYEDEIASLRKSMSTAANELSDTGKTARFIIGYIISSDEDIAYAEEQASEYGFEPVMILDCAEGLAGLRKLALSASQSGHEIMLTASDYVSEVNVSIKSLLTYMSDRNIECSDIYLLRNDYYTDDDVDLLISDGFLGYTVYNTTPDSGVTDEGYITLDYSYLTTDSSSYTRFDLSYSNKATIVIALDVSSIREGTLTEGFVSTLLDTVCAYVGNDDCEFSGVSDAVTGIIEEDETEKELFSEYEAYVAECEARIEELEEIIAGIYSDSD